MDNVTFWYVVMSSIVYLDIFLKFLFGFKNM